MKFVVIKIMIALGFISFFKGTSEVFHAHADEGTLQREGHCETMGGGSRSGGCGKSN